MGKGSFFNVSKTYCPPVFYELSGAVKKDVCPMNSVRWVRHEKVAECLRLKFRVS